jgi:hypothetical protein
LTAPAHWSGYVYYYVASLIGLGLLIAGVIGIFNGAIQVAAPASAPEYRYRVPEVPKLEESPGATAPAQPQNRRQLERDAATAVRREGVYRAARGLVLAVVGTPVFAWHIRRARRLESRAD